MKGTRLAMIGVALVSLVGSVPAAATFLEFSDQGAWLAAAGAIVGDEDFESFAADTSFDGSSLALDDGMTIGTLAADGGDVNLVDVPPLGGAEVNGTAYALIYTGLDENRTTPFLRFASPVAAFGAFFKGLSGDDEQRTIVELFDGAVLLASFVPPQADEEVARFWGFASDSGELVTEIHLRRFQDDEEFGMDDIQIGNGVVPEPATSVLLGLGLSGLGLLGRRRSG